MQASLGHPLESEMGGEFLLELFACPASSPSFPVPAGPTQATADAQPWTKAVWISLELTSATREFIISRCTWGPACRPCFPWTVGLPPHESQSSCSVDD